MTFWAYELLIQALPEGRNLAFFWLSKKIFSNICPLDENSVQSTVHLLVSVYGLIISDVLLNV